MTWSTGRLERAVFVKQNIRYRIGGVAAWAGLCGLGWFGLAGSPTSSRGDLDAVPVSATSQWFPVADQVTVTDPTQQMRVNDPVFANPSGRGDWVQAGYVSNVETAKDSNQLMIAWYLPSLSTPSIDWAVHRTSGSLQEVVATMLPPSKQAEIRARLERLLAEHGKEMSRTFAPLVKQTLVRSLPIIEDGIRSSLDRHRDEWTALVKRLETQVLKERLLPLAKEQVLPIVRLHGEPVAEEIGRELWDRASIWRFGWRAVYDKTPLPQKGLVQEEWKRFVNDEAVPVFESHFEEIATAIQRTLQDVIADEVVRQELATVAAQVASDDQAKALIKTVLREAIVDNEQLRAGWEDVWSSDEARAAIRMAGDRIEPVIREIGDDLFGTPETGIDPNFAKVLRNQILGKDRRWLVARDTGVLRDGMAVARRGDSDMPIPVVYMAE